jgi:hypothetical protein
MYTEVVDTPPEDSPAPAADPSRAKEASMFAPHIPGRRCVLAPADQERPRARGPSPSAELFARREACSPLRRPSGGSASPAAASANLRERGAR